MSGEWKLSNEELSGAVATWMGEQGNFAVDCDDAFRVIDRLSVLGYVVTFQRDQAGTRVTIVKGERGQEHSGEFMPCVLCELVARMVEDGELNPTPSPSPVPSVQERGGGALDDGVVTKEEASEAGKVLVARKRRGAPLPTPDYVLQENAG